MERFVERVIRIHCSAHPRHPPRSGHLHSGYRADGAPGWEQLNNVMRIQAARGLPAQHPATGWTGRNLCGRRGHADLARHPRAANPGAHSYIQRYGHEPSRCATLVPWPLPGRSPAMMSCARCSSWRRLHHRPVQPAVAPRVLPAHPQHDDAPAEMAGALPRRAGPLPAAATRASPGRQAHPGLPSLRQPCPPDTAQARATGQGADRPAGHAAQLRTALRAIISEHGPRHCPARHR